MKMMLEILVPLVLIAAVYVAGRFMMWRARTRVVRAMRRLAAQGDPDGLVGMGIFCWDKGEYASAADFFEQAVEKKHAEGKAWLGRCYMEGAGVEQDVTRALELYRQSAESGAAEGCLQLGNCYLEGKGVQKDAREAVRLYEQAVAQDDEDAQYRLGMCCLDGVGLPADRERGIDLLRRAAYMLQPDAMNELEKRGVSFTTIEDDGE